MEQMKFSKQFKWEAVCLLDKGIKSATILGINWESGLTDYSDFTKLQSTVPEFISNTRKAIALLVLDVDFAVLAV